MSDAVDAFSRPTLCGFIEGLLLTFQLVVARRNRLDTPGILAQRTEAREKNQKS